MLYAVFNKHSQLLIISVLLLTVGIKITDNNFNLRLLYSQLTDDSAFIETNYVDPRSVEIAFPEQKRNLIYIFVESLETSYLSEELGGAQPVNLIPEITKLMQDNISFSSTDHLGGGKTLTSQWTAASLVSQTAGIPLMAININMRGRNNKFLPNAYAIGQILEKEGYSNTFIMGSDSAFAGRDIYFSSHGNYRLLDWNYARGNGIIPPDYYAWWGFEDEKLYPWAKDEALRLSKEGLPFNLTILTADTHHIGGYLSDFCRDEYGEHDEQYANVWSCASRQLYDFVSWVKEQDFFENTTIVIVGDHLSMDPYFFTDLDPEFEREVIAIFINSELAPYKSYNRQFSTLDMFPSTLASLGVEIPGNRLGLGVNLFSQEPTIIEEYSESTVMTEFRKLSRFYNEKFW